MTRFNRLARLASVVMLLAFAVPLGGLAWATLREPGRALDVVTSARALRPFGRSLLVGVTASLLAGVLGTATAWLIARSDVPGRRALAVLANLPLAMPSFVGAFAMRFAFGPGGLIPPVPRLDGLAGATVVLALFSFPYVTLPVTARLLVASPAIEESARMLGSGPRRVFADVVWPQIRPAVWSGSMLVFLYAMSDFGAVSIMRYDTATRVIFSARLADPTAALTLGVLLAITAVGAASLAHRTPIRFARSSPGSVSRYPLGRWRMPAFAAVWLVIGAALAAPVAAFATWWIRGWSGTGGGRVALGEGLAGLAGPVLNTASAGLVAAVVTAVLLLPLGREAGLRTRIGAIGSRAAAATFALPGVLVAAAIVFVVVRAPGPVFAFYQTFPLLVVAYVISFGAYSVSTTADALGALPDGYSEAAATLGAGPGRRFRSIELPLVLPAVTAGGGLVLLSVVKELPATLLLAPIGFDTLATRVWNTAGEGFLADAGLASLVLLGVSAVLTWFFVLRPTAALTRSLVTTGHR